WIDPEDVVLFLLERFLQALIVTLDPVARIREPDRAVGSDGDVVRRVQLLAVVLVGDNGDRAVELSLGHPSAAVLARYQATFPIDGVAIGIHRRLTEYAQVIVVFQQAHYPVVGNVAEEKVAAGREIHRAFCPAEPGGDALDRAGPTAALESRVERFDM